jgi:hypothetical protein
MVNQWEVDLYHTLSGGQPAWCNNSQHMQLWLVTYKVWNLQSKGPHATN